MRTFLVALLLLVAHKAHAAEEFVRFDDNTKYVAHFVNCYTKLGLKPDDDYAHIIKIKAVGGQITKMEFFELYKTPAVDAVLPEARKCKEGADKLQVSAK